MCRMALGDPSCGKIPVPWRRLQCDVLQSSPETHQVYSGHVPHHWRLLLRAYCDRMVKWQKWIPISLQKLCCDPHYGDGRI